MKKGELDNFARGCQINDMDTNGIQNHQLPDLRNPLLIIGLGGWGNAMKISSAMAAYLIRHFNAAMFAEIDPDVFYRYDDMRPVVSIEDGIFKKLEPPGGALYAAKLKNNLRDLVILSADEPNLNWFGFVKELFDLCQQLQIEKIITLGSMFDNVLHTDRIISAVASDMETMSLLNEKGVNSISYNGPSAIHSIIHAEGMKRGFSCLSLWTHCPYYLQGTTHYGLMAHLGSLLSLLGGFQIGVEELERNWDQLKEHIENLVEENAQLKAVIEEIRKVKKRGMTAELKAAIQSDEKVIHINDFLKPK